MLKPTIGIEVHIELKSNAKVFSTSKNTYDNTPNEYVDEIDLGYPGTLPLLNRQVVNCALQAAISFHCKINQTMHFDRKNYFYPDLPKGYQITQSDTPIGQDGYLTIQVDGEERQIEIERIHIEEDTCKSIHGMSGTLLNFNRAGVPLIEIVSKPVMHSAEEAVQYLDMLRLTLLHLGISDVKIEEGSMRCDANVSLSENDLLGTKTEIKNIGSITNVGLSIHYEIERQKAILEQGGKIVEETRRFDDKTGTTILMRVKETGNDYRYFPEPDIPYITVSDEWINEVKEQLPLLPAALKSKYVKLGMNENTIRTLINQIDLCHFLEAVMDNCNPVLAANILTGDVLSYLNKNKIELSEIKLNHVNFRDLVLAIDENKISSKQGKELLLILMEQGGEVKTLIEDLGMVQITDNTELLIMVNQVIDENPESIDDYKAGKDRALKFLMGQIMKVSKGKANPKLVNDLLVQELQKR